MFLVGERPDVASLVAELTKASAGTRSGSNGYFDRLGFDPRAGTGTGPGTRDDEPTAARVRDLVKTVRESRDVVLSTGPFLHVTAGGRGPSKPWSVIGGIMRGGEVEVSVVDAPWVAVDTGELRFVNRPSAAPVAIAAKKDTTGAMVVEASFVVSPMKNADDAFVVILSGTRPMRPVIAGPDAELLPWAMSGPIWLDGNGDGKSLGR